MQNIIWNTPIEYVKGAGPVKGELLRKELDVFTIGDLLSDYPIRYIDRTTITPIKSIRPDQSYVQFVGEVISMHTVGEKYAKRLVATVRDGYEEIELVWFQSIKYFESFLQTGEKYLFFGKVNLFRESISIVHPEAELFKSEEDRVKGFMPVYRSTAKLDKKFLDSKGRRPIIYEALKMLQNSELEDPLTPAILQKYKLRSLKETLINIHFPKTSENLLNAERRIKYEEFFYMQLDLIRQMKTRKVQIKGFLFEQVGDKFNTFYSTYLPFDLTNAQKTVLKEIRQDTVTGKQMNRLLQGDVGSGKTIIGFMAALLAIDNGFQACIMAPTEILARQHLESIQNFSEHLDLNIALLTGNVKGKLRKQVLADLAEGNIDIIIGTHALIEDAVVFKNLGLTIIDEQHRFGVAQRAKLWKKNPKAPPHILVMTATPIPRTLHMTLYGDLDVSVIDELPPGRKPIATKRLTAYSRPKLNEFLKSEIKIGRQVYIVYPLIEESEKLDLASLMEGYDQIVKDFPPPEYKISIVHGKMTQEQKDFEMGRFVDGTTQILVSTTVIEVGVNVPNASVMVIENSERFGLSQLHQLRGRVGRGADQSYCFLMTGLKVSKDASIKLNTMVETNDGFKIAEVDLQLRGPGNIDGTQQSGLIELKLANIITDSKILEVARNDAFEILNEDPRLDKPEHAPLKRYMHQKYGKSKSWSLIS